MELLDNVLALIMVVIINLIMYWITNGNITMMTFSLVCILLYRSYISELNNC